MKKFILSILVLMFLPTISFAFEHIRSDGNGGYWNGNNHIRSDGNGGYWNGNNHIRSDGNGGYWK